MRENDVREGSSLVVQGRLTIKNYLNRRGAWAPSYSITAEKLALAVNVGFVVDRVVEGERPVNRNATVESTRQRLFADKVLRQDFSDEFIAEIRQGQTAAHDQVFVRQFQEHFPRSALGLENSAVLALAESFSSSHRKMLLFGEPARMTPQVLRTVLVNSPVLFEQGHLTQTMLIAFLDAMFFSIAQSASESTSASTATDDVVMRTA
ncbi:hypothetical protein BDB00DRAFT_847824 [Zychaea mexicana]|uniref:uncharacterized protein n=1 Tax=Zychaea mexicana TaxID=64656 RepID=UPI0022FE8E5A|nr:uncharacterized protein BDB00DRAFT_847824 [Zychaea mexicana]KAI9488474.1 hypothetical protein BDB00DRAFT_847824 [Zychaea mexicana]